MLLQVMLFLILNVAKMLIRSKVPVKYYLHYQFPFVFRHNINLFTTCCGRIWKVLRITGITKITRLPVHHLAQLQHNVCNFCCVLLCCVLVKVVVSLKLFKNCSAQFKFGYLSSLHYFYRPTIFTDFYFLPTNYLLL